MVSTDNHFESLQSQVLQTLQTVDNSHKQSMQSLYGLMHDFKTEMLNIQHQLQADRDKQSATCSLSQYISLSGSSHERGECVVSISRDDVLPTVASQETYAKVASSRVETVSASADACSTSKTSQHDVSGRSSQLHVLKRVQFQNRVGQDGLISDSMQKILVEDNVTQGFLFHNNFEKHVLFQCGVTADDTVRNSLPCSQLIYGR